MGVTAVNHAIQRYLVAVKALLWCLCSLPLGWLTAGAFGLAAVDLGANPVETIIHTLGLWGLKLLFITLAITPLRRWLHMPALTRLRRLLGLFAFCYIALHFLAYAVIDQQLAWGAIVEDIIERPYITLGIVALSLLLPLAGTSTLGMQRRLGRRWKSLHRLIYAIAILGVWHFYWQVKQDVLEPLIYAAILAILLGDRVWAKMHRPRPAREFSTN